jgi:hypothetical protein
MTLKKSPTSKSSMVSSKSMAELSTKSNGSKSLQVDEDEKKNGKHKGNAHAGGWGMSRRICWSLVSLSYTVILLHCISCQLLYFLALRSVFCSCSCFGHDFGILRLSYMETILT